MLSLLTYIVVGLIGLMMGTIYKYSISNIEGLRVAPERVTRWYYTLMIVGIAICGYLSYRAVHSFSELGMAEDKAHFFEDNRAMLIYFLNVGFIVLIVMANLHSLVSKRISWHFYILTFGMYAAFAVLDNFFLADTFFHFKQIHQIWQGSFNLDSYWGYLSLCICAALTVFNGYMSHWGLKK